MAQIILDIPNPIATRVQNAICARFGYQDTIIVNGTNTPNPETKAQFAKRMIAREVKGWILEYELNAAINTTRQTEYTRLDTELSIT